MPQKRLTHRRRLSSANRAGKNLRARLPQNTASETEPDESNSTLYRDVMRNPDSTKKRSTRMEEQKQHDSDATKTIEGPDVRHTGGHCTKLAPANKGFGGGHRRAV
jgi:hypothetical protein